MLSPRSTPVMIVAGIALLAAAAAVAENTAKKVLLGDTKVDVLARWQGAAPPKPGRIVVYDFDVPVDVVSVDRSPAARVHLPRHGEQGSDPNSPEEVARQVRASFAKSLAHELQAAKLPVEVAAADGVPSNGGQPVGADSSGGQPVGAVPSGGQPEGAVSSGGQSEGAVSSGAQPEGALSTGTPPEDAASNGSPPEGAASSGAQAGAAFSQGAQAPPGSLVVHGDFTAIKQGNKTKRIFIGFGKGASDVQAHVTVSEVGADQQPLTLLEFNVRSKSGKKPGAAVTVGAGAATLGTVTAGSAAAGVATGGVLDRAATVEADAARMAKGVAKQVLDLLRSRQWAPSP